jgi:hypothetical protein
MNNEQTIAHSGSNVPCARVAAYLLTLMIPDAGSIGARVGFQKIERYNTGVL